MPRLFCFGYGYCARALAELYVSQGWEIVGTVRGGALGTARLADEGKGRGKSAAAAAKGRANGTGVRLVFFDRDHPLLPEDFAGTTHVLVSIPPDETGDPVLNGAWDAMVAARETIQWIGYLSSTGVYGDHGGNWVDETVMPAPTSPRAQRRAAAEASWLVLGHEQNLPVHIFRLSGIYGPGRSVFDELRAGTAQRIVKPGHLFGRIHVADIATTLAASIARPNPGAIYNVSDDEPAAPADVVAYAAALMGVRPPREVPFEKAELSPMAATFWADNRRISNVRIKRELGVRLAYPTYREGLQAIHAADR